MQTNTKKLRGTDQVVELIGAIPSRKVGKQPRAPLFEIPELRAARRFAANRHSALKKAEDIGYVDGFSDRHEVDHEFDSGAEWIAWCGIRGM